MLLIDDLERILVRRARDGDAAAFGELTARHRTSALRVATVVLGTATGADDAVQDADVRAWRFRASVDPDRSFRSWYLRVVANVAKSARRSSGRRAVLELREAATASSDVRDPADEAVTDEERRRAIAAINRLGADDRLVIALRHFEQMTEAEMADVMRCAPGTVKSRLSRAMDRLRAQMREQHSEVAS